MELDPGLGTLVEHQPREHQPASRQNQDEDPCAAQDARTRVNEAARVPEVHLCDPRALLDRDGHVLSVWAPRHLEPTDDPLHGRVAACEHRCTHLGLGAQAVEDRLGTEPELPQRLDAWAPRPDRRVFLRWHVHRKSTRDRVAHLLENGQLRGGPVPEPCLREDTSIAAFRRRSETKQTSGLARARSHASHADQLAEAIRFNPATSQMPPLARIRTSLDGQSIAGRGGQSIAPRRRTQRP